MRCIIIRFLLILAALLPFQAQATIMIINWRISKPGIDTTGTTTVDDDGTVVTDVDWVWDTAPPAKLPDWVVDVLDDGPPEEVDVTIEDQGSTQRNKEKLKEESTKQVIRRFIRNLLNRLRGIVGATAIAPVGDTEPSVNVRCEVNPSSIQKALIGVVRARLKAIPGATKPWAKVRLRRAVAPASAKMGAAQILNPMSFDFDPVSKTLTILGDTLLGSEACKVDWKYTVKYGATINAEPISGISEGTISVPGVYR